MLSLKDLDTKFRRRHVTAGMIGAALTYGSVCAAPAPVTITLQDNVTGRSMPAVKVSIEPHPERRISNADGKATFPSLAPGVYTVHAAAAGYMDTWEPVEVKDGQENDFTVYMAEEDPSPTTQGLPPRAIPYTFGVNVHGHPVTEEVEAVARAGFKFHRLGMEQDLITNAHWKGYQNGKYVFGYLSPGGGGDGPVATIPAYLKRGVRMLGIIEYDSVKFKGVPKTDAERADWAEFCRQIAQAFKGKQIIYELSNEPMWYTMNWNTERDAPLYVLAAKAAADAIHAVDPDAVVCAPGGAFTDEYVRAGLSDVVDAYSDHFYTDGPPEVNSRAYQRVKGLLAEYSHKPKPVPIINSEQGFSWQDKQDAGPNVGSEERHAQYIARMFLVDLMNDCRLTCWYDWNHLAGEPAGYKGAHASPQALQAFKTLVTELDGYRYLCRMDKGAGNFVLVFQKGKSRRYAAWSVGNPTVEVLIGARRAEVVSLKGDSRTTVEAPAGKITITLDGSVQYIKPVDSDSQPRRADERGQLRASKKSAAFTDHRSAIAVRR